MSPIIHSYRHLSIALCSYSRSFCKINTYRRKSLSDKDLRMSGQGGVLTCKTLPVMCVFFVGVV